MNYQGYSLRHVLSKSYWKTNLLVKAAIMSLLLLSSCYSLKFTSDNVMKLRVGMTSDEVIEIFGKPMSTKATTCGTSTGDPWGCILWYYGEYKPYFIFSEIGGVLFLNSWET